MSDKKYVEGVRFFNPHPKSPDFVKGTVVITPNDLIEWLKENKSVLTDYNGKKQLKLQMLEGNKGIYFKVDDFVPSGKQSISPEVETDDLPF